MKVVQSHLKHIFARTLFFACFMEKNQTSCEVMQVQGTKTKLSRIT